MLAKQEKRYRRHKRVRAKVFGTNKVPRLCIFRSNKHIYGQLIDDEKGKTLIAESDLKLKSKIKRDLTGRPAGQQKSKTKIENKKTEESKQAFTAKIAIAYDVGNLLAKKALEKNIKKVVFDRAGYKYHGRVKALAQGAREGGLKF